MLNIKLDFLKIISKTSSTDLIDNLEFQLAPNNIYTILGKNGTGKTSLIFAITKLLDENKFSYKGSVEFFGEDIFLLLQKKLAEFRSQNIRYVFQDPIGSLDPLKNIEYYFDLLKISDVEIDEQLDYFQLPSYDKIRKLHPYELSVGMAQRVNIVLALLAKPKLLILDEPTSALDLPIANLLLDSLKQFAAKDDNVVLIVTQDIVFAKNVSDFISVLANKKLSPFRSSNEISDNNSECEYINLLPTYNEIVK